ncbi:diguanylate cyclase [Alkalihalobacillus alcalophilus ATCC 27647 = CGMCC 1.3604]|uniref:Diguanylate cyclase n=1 Tax=Alkalihalobacillus alcalophilus ATCC 27647 = CGMCC 1.3604 TaxID=1218173 RepID=A0A4S4JYU4_ALKAL|nr:dipeptidase [Alkalihalobacillus alcalophilus]THG90465.1 diguanylate cyclase [Alkalihalobacillus alcalophilus ATCC 27647 = CGMCC 1.3604]
MSINLIDSHCDVLLKLIKDKKRTFYDDKNIQANYLNLKKGEVKVQFFAIFVEPEIEQNQKFQNVLEQVEAFYERVLKPNPNMKHIKNWHQVEQLREGEIGAVLALEGLDAIGNDQTKLSLLYQLGVLSIGITWNGANLCGDGVGEPRGAGLTELGKAIVTRNNQYSVLTDVSHLSEAGFWDVLELSTFPIASHSNAKSICQHPRNLTDSQIKAIVQKGGYIGLVLYPVFLNGTKKATVSDLVRHIEHFCLLGAGGHIGIGSDFDGIDSVIDGVEHSGQYPSLFSELSNYFSDDFLNGLAAKNFKAFLARKLAN